MLAQAKAVPVPWGVKLGRKPKLTPHQIKEVWRRKANGEAVREIARSYNVHNSTISRLTAHGSRHQPFSVGTHVDHWNGRMALKPCD